MDKFFEYCPWNLRHMVKAVTYPSPVSLSLRPPIVPKRDGSRVLWNTLNVLAEDRGIMRGRKK